MFKFFFKLLVIASVIIWSINANATKCIQKSHEKSEYKNISGIFLVNALNLRSGSGMEFCIKRVLRNVRGKKVKVVGSRNNWRLISIEGQTFWIHNSLITVIPSINLALI